jgi:uncharacterized membrane protein YkvI
MVALVRHFNFNSDKGLIETVPAISATFIGTVVGAGFASGQEILQFFGVYGTYGFLGILIAVFLMGFAGVKVFKIGYQLKPKSYQEFLIFILGKRFAPIVDFLLSIFFMVLIGVMLAGSGALCESVGVYYWTGEILTAILLMVVLFFDMAGLISANLIVIPLMLIGSVSISLYGLFSKSATLFLPSFDFPWIFAALQFSAYNVILAIPVLLALAQEYRHLGHLKLGSWIGSLGLGLMAGFMQWALLAHFPQLGKQALPMIELAKGAGRIPYWGYAVILWGEMFTTLLANTYGLARRLTVLSRWSYRIWLILITLGGMVIAQVGFINLIANCYPLFGVLSLIILVLLFFKTSGFSVQKS